MTRKSRRRKFADLHESDPYLFYENNASFLPSNSFCNGERARKTEKDKKYENQGELIYAYHVLLGFYKFFVHGRIRTTTITGSQMKHFCRTVANYLGVKSSVVEIELRKQKNSDSEPEDSDDPEAALKCKLKKCKEAFQQNLEQLYSAKMDRKVANHDPEISEDELLGKMAGKFFDKTIKPLDELYEKYFNDERRIIREWRESQKAAEKAPKTDKKGTSGDSSVLETSEVQHSITVFLAGYIASDIGLDSGLLLDILDGKNTSLESPKQFFYKLDKRSEISDNLEAPLVCRKFIRRLCDLNRLTDPSRGTLSVPQLFKLYKIMNDRFMPFFLISQALKMGVLKTKEMRLSTEEEYVPDPEDFCDLNELRKQYVSARSS